MMDVYLGLGSNVGDRERQMRLALEWIDQVEGVSIKKISRFYKTKAVSTTPQPDFLNAAVYLQTVLTPDELFTIFWEMEKKSGRKTKGNYDPRPLDIDILFYGTQIICSESLTIPHPLLQDRLFVLIPLAEIAPDFLHPILDISVVDLKRRLEKK